jgi:hypothetical protein
VAVRLILKVPGGKLTVGFCVVANCVQPVVAVLYSHFHEVGVLSDKSVNATKSGAVPERGGLPDESVNVCISFVVPDRMVPEKHATGGATFMVIVLVLGVQELGQEFLGVSLTL